MDISNEGMQVHYGFFNKNAQYRDSTFRGKALPSLSHAIKGSIKALHMASGATIAYTYELNLLPTGKPGAGLRVSEKVEDPGDTAAKTTKYTYAEPSVNTLPRHVSQNKKNIYWQSTRGAEATF